jgi:predicted aspartyl protease
VPILRGRIRPGGALAQVTLGPSQIALGADTSATTTSATVWALFDTGADITVVQPSLIERLGVFPHDRIEVVGLHESTATCDVFDINLELEGTGIALPNLTVVGGAIGGDPKVQVLLGRSVLWKGVFVYDGLDQTFSFDVP